MKHVVNLEVLLQFGNSDLEIEILIHIRSKRLEI